jgi:hypothetical protein
MTREAAPAFQFYVKDWRSSRKVQVMSFAARGMYLEMLLEQWEHGSLPATPAEMATLLGGTKGEWTRAWPALSVCFVARKPDGRLVNAKLEAVRRERQKYIKAQRESGLLGAKVRWGKDGEPIGSPSKPIGTPLAKNGSSSSSSSSSVRTEDRARAERSSEPSKEAPAHRRPNGGVVAGALPRDHVGHALCDDTHSLCVPRAVHDKLADRLAPRYGGDRETAKAALVAWYPTIWATLPADFVMGDAFSFWQPRFDVAFATKETPAAAGEPKRPPGCHHTPACVDEVACTSLRGVPSREGPSEFLARRSRRTRPGDAKSPRA